MHFFRHYNDKKTGLLSTVVLSMYVQDKKM